MADPQHIRQTAARNLASWPLEMQWTGDIPLYGIREFVDAQDLPPPERTALYVGLGTLDLLSRGPLNRQVAAKHFRTSPEGISTQLRHAADYLGAQSLAQAVGLGIESGAIRVHVRSARLKDPLLSRCSHVMEHIMNGGGVQRIRNEIASLAKTPQLSSRNVESFMRRGYEFGVRQLPPTLPPAYPAALWGLAPRPDVRPLSRYQRIGLEYSASGLSYRQAAAKRGVSEATLQTHMSYAQRKYQAASTEELLTKAIIRGDIEIAPGAKPFVLTPEELEIAALVVKGFANKQIARQAGVYVDTVKNRLSRLYGELHMDKTVIYSAKRMRLRLVYWLFETSIFAVDPTRRGFYDNKNPRQNWQGSK